MKNLIFALSLLTSLLPLPGFTQGCSDAGFCTLPGIKTTAGIRPEAEDLRNTLKLGSTYGRGDRNISIVTSYLEYRRNLSEALSLTGKATFAASYGELCDHSGFGDLFVSADYRLGTSSVTLGLKAPLGRADAGNEAGDYPMSYQSTLGTFDLIAGAGQQFRHFGAGAAVQLPLVPSNKNRFLPESHPDARALAYPPANQYERKGDLLGRVTYQFDLPNGKGSLRPGLLPIYHWANDTYVDAGGQRREIAGSRGVTLNWNLFLNWKLSETGGLELNFGAPLVARKSRPDGLTRKFVAGLEYALSF